MKDLSGDLLEFCNWGSMVHEILDHIMNIVPHVFHPLGKRLQSTTKPSERRKLACASC